MSAAPARSTQKRDLDMAEAGGTTSDVEIIAVEPRLAAVVRKRVPFASIPETQRKAHTALSAAFESANVQPIGPWLTVWRTPQDGLIDYAPGVFVPEGTREMNGIDLFALPQGRAAHLRLQGPYEGLPDAWGRLFAGCKAHRLAGLNWEIYSVPNGGQEKIQTDLYAFLS
jgi:effector-binding domain-containing protein